MRTHKDERLVELAEQHNIAQFVSFSPGSAPEIRYSRIRGHAPDEPYTGVQAAIGALIRMSAGTVNIRSFRPGRDKGNPFEYGIGKVEDAARIVGSLAAEGYSTIVNETIDTNDGGVSGVTLGGVMEFTPFDTPRGVEKAGVASLPHQIGLDVLRGVYGFTPDVGARAGDRLEFSVHPLRVGYRRSHTLLWELEQGAPVALEAKVTWPNRFSRLLGDKAFGLLIADVIGLPVPSTTVFPRDIAPFRFGRATGTSEFWMRTCPAEPRPGLFTTTFGWADPYSVLSREDPDGTVISSVLAQESVDPEYSGASLPAEADEPDHVEGIGGRGDEFMLGRRRPEELPALVVRDVRELARRARQVLGSVRLEFVHDGRQAWVVQLHLSADRYKTNIINPGEPADGWLDFHPDSGLDRLRDLIAQAEESGNGVRVTGQVGLTSHVGDLLRRADVPARLDLR
jgi:hypothetical protein